MKTNLHKPEPIFCILCDKNVTNWKAHITSKKHLDNWKDPERAERIVRDFHEDLFRKTAETKGEKRTAAQVFTAILDTNKKLWQNQNTP